MGGDLLVSTATLLGFLLTLARVAGVFVFVPMPGAGVVNPARAILAFGITIALFVFMVPQVLWLSGKTKAAVPEQG